MHKKTWRLPAGLAGRLQRWAKDHREDIQDIIAKAIKQADGNPTWRHVTLPNEYLVRLGTQVSQDNLTWLEKTAEEEEVGVREILAQVLAGYLQLEARSSPAWMEFTQVVLEEKITRPFLQRIRPPRRGGDSVFSVKRDEERLVIGAEAILLGLTKGRSLEEGLCKSLLRETGPNLATTAWDIAYAFTCLDEGKAPRSAVRGLLAGGVDVLDLPPNALERARGLMEDYGVTSRFALRLTTAISTPGCHILALTEAEAKAAKSVKTTPLFLVEDGDR